MRLYYHKNPENAAALKIVAAAAYIGVDLQSETASVSEWVNETENFKEYYDPLGQYPVLELDEADRTSSPRASSRPMNNNNNTVFGANAILRLIGRCDTDDTYHVYGYTPFEASQVDMWITYSQNEIDAANAPYIEAQFVHNDSGATKVPASAFANVERVFTALDEVLTIRTFLVGERLSLADIAVAFSVQLCYRCNRKNGEELAKKYKAVYRHYNTVMRNPKIKEVLRKAGATLGPMR